MDRIPRRVPTQTRVGRDNEDAAVKTRVTTKLTPRVKNNDHNNSVHHALLGPSVSITKAKDAFVVGDGFYRASRYDKAMSAFQTAAENDSRNALYYYLLAMTHYELRQFGEAENMAQKAIRLEQDGPIENWGSRLSRYQGHPRLWVEQRRSAFRNAIND